MIDRDKTAAARDAIADEIDATAENRDQRSEARDQRAELRDEIGGRPDGNATSDRSAARRDRKSAAGDRRHAGDDREAAATDRRIAAAESSSLVIDDLTGTYLRGPGLTELSREVVKVQRTGQSLVLAFIDVDDLKATNDSLGHEAGDRRLTQVAECLRSNLREYDVVVRYGGDEFLCGLIDMPLSVARQRFDQVDVDLAISGDGSVSIGLVQLETGEDLEALIRRADEAMYAGKDATD
jgi:diguanylate cyclase (GGDEF)-like protein